jgi:hypothetical protein
VAATNIRFSRDEQKRATGTRDSGGRAHANKHSQSKANMKEKSKWAKDTEENGYKTIKFRG